MLGTKHTAISDYLGLEYEASSVKELDKVIEDKRLDSGNYIVRVSLEKEYI